MQTVVTLIDISISSRPWRYGHIWHTWLYAIVYLAFQVIYIMVFDGTDGNDNEYVYDIFQWKSEPLKATGVAFGVILSAALVYTILWLFAFVRDKLWESCISKSQDKVFILQFPEVNNYNNNQNVAIPNVE